MTTSPVGGVKRRQIHRLHRLQHRPNQGSAATQPRNDGAIKNDCSRSHSIKF
jgi:hypothetical protein